MTEYAHTASLHCGLIPSVLTPVSQSHGMSTKYSKCMNCPCLYIEKPCGHTADNTTQLCHVLPVLQEDRSEAVQPFLFQVNRAQS